jgi:hypothetical protein
MYAREEPNTRRYAYVQANCTQQQISLYYSLQVLMEYRDIAQVCVKLVRDAIGLSQMLMFHDVAKI